MARVAWIVVALLLAGCSEPPAQEVADEPEAPCVAEGVCGQDGLVTEDGRDLRTDLTKADSLDAPEWEVGDVFEQHLFLGNRDEAGTHIKTIVIEANDGYRIATPDPASARYEAVYDLPVLGNIGPGLETTAFGSDWSWMYDFPLHHGKTWNGQVDGLLNWNTYSFTDYELQMSVQYDGAIDTPNGDFPGFWIDASTPTGEALARYNYVPAIGWFSHFWLYDLDNGGGEFMFHAMSMGTDTNFTGTYVEAAAETVLEHFQGVFPDPAGPVQGDPAPQTFAVPESQRMMGIIVPVAFMGQMEVTLTDPSGTGTRYGYQQLDQDGPGFTVVFYDEYAKPGDWNMRALGVGVATGLYVWLNAVTVTEAQL